MPVEKSSAREKSATWGKSSDDLVALFEQLVPNHPNVERRKMFGYNCAFVNGNFFIGLFQQGMTFRLSPPDQAAFMEHPDTGFFEPMAGRRMNGYVIHRAPFAAGDEVLTNWINCSLEFASKLPSKAKGAKKSAAKKAPAVNKKRP